MPAFEILELIWKIVSSRIGSVVIAATVCGSYGFASGWHHASARAKQAEVAAVTDALLDQALVTADVTAAAAKRAEEADRHSLDLQGKLDDYVKELAARKPDARCVLSRDDVHSLRAIGGGSASNPSVRAR